MKLYGWSIKLNNSLTIEQNASCYKKGAKTTLYLTNEYYEKYIQEKNYLNFSLVLNSNGYLSKTVDNVITDFKIEKSNTQFNFLEYGDDVKFDNINCALIRDKKANNVLNTLSNAGYSCANTYDIVTNQYQYFTIFDAVLSVAAIIVIVIGIYIITYMILHIIYKSKKNDYNIMRTLGVTNKSMRKIVNYEMLIISSISALVVSIVFLTVSSFVKNSFTQLYTNCNILYYLLYIALMIGLSLLITTRFNRRLFKFSVNNSFEGRIK
jgi:ABC-type antimicrobial peptide transport system permease subunit